MVKKNYVCIEIELNFLKSDLKNENENLIQIYNNWTIDDKIKYVQKHIDKIMKSDPEDINDLTGIIGEKNANNIKSIEIKIIKEHIILQIKIESKKFDLNGEDSIDDFKDRIEFTSLSDAEWSNTESSLWIVLTDHWDASLENPDEVGLISIENVTIY